MNLYNQIAACVRPGQEPAVYISGGLDSTIILHHLREKIPDKIIRTYTAKFGTSGDELDQAKQVAEYYNTVHKSVEANLCKNRLKKLQKLFDKPRFNLWPDFLAQEAKHDGCKTVYIGEGSDELFGGYSDRDYLHGWAGQLMYVQPTYIAIHKHRGLTLEQPFMSLYFTQVLSYYAKNKAALRNEYEDILPDFVISRPIQAPGFCQYKQLLNFSGTNEEAKLELQKLACEAWLEVHK